MAKPLEIEIKLAATPALLEKLRSDPVLAGEEQASTLTTTYFDTSGGHLRRGGAALRVRRGETGREQTLKLAPPNEGAIRRFEWNAELVGDHPELANFPAKARTVLAQLLDGEPLEPVATTRIERTTRRLHLGQSAIEIAFDLGRIEAGVREETVCELEMELVEGKLADVIALALKLPLGPELNWSVRSKAERCHALAYALPLKVAHAGSLNLSPALDVAGGFQAIAWNCLQQILANYPLVIASGDAEAVHQTRVAIRRLRAAMSLFADVTDDATEPLLRSELKAVGSSLGPARDLDVLLERISAEARARDSELSWVRTHLAARRKKAVASAQSLLADASFQRLLFKFASWLEDGEWLRRKGESGGDLPLQPFAAQSLARRRRKLRQIREKLADLSDADRHKLRIEVKKLRYATAFFASLFSSSAVAKERKAFTRHLGKLQDSLGELNDMAVASADREALFSGLNPIEAAEQAARLEEHLADQHKSRRKLIKSAQKSFDKIVSAEAWWKAG